MNAPKIVLHHHGSFRAMSISIVLLCFVSFANAQNTPVSESNKVYIGGPKYSQQIFLRTDTGDKVLSNFKNWELIKELFLSPDQKNLVVYHRPDKANGFILSLYSLESCSLVAEFEPGWACNEIHWTKDCIIWEWATSGGGTRLVYLDYHLKTVRQIVSYRWFFDIESDIVLGLVIYGADDGSIRVYRYSDGLDLKIVNFKQEIGANYICSKCEKLGTKKYRLSLKDTEHDRMHIVVLEL